MELKTSVLKLNIEEKRRIIAVSDIHGHCACLKELLKKAEFSPGDELILCGDYIERGTENLESLRYVMELSAQPNVHALSGNMDLFTARLIDGDAGKSPELIYERINHMNEKHGSCLITEMCAEAGLAVEKAADIPEVITKLRQLFRKELDFILTLPHLIETRTLLFVHGGIPSENIGEILELNPYALLKNDNFMNKGFKFSKYVIVGHYPTTIYRGIPSCAPIIDRESHIIDIDGGCGVNDFGQLNALIIPSLLSQDFSHVKVDFFPLFTAEAAQEERIDTINIIWTDNEVELLEKKAFSAVVRRISDGAVTEVPGSYLFTDEGWLRCDNFNSYRLPVRRGETFGLIKTEPGFGRLLKKNDVFGWYMDENTNG